GSFLLLREELDLLTRLTAEADDAEAVLLGGDAQDQSSQVTQHLQLSGRALMHGDVEAGLLHTALALRARASLVGEVPEDLIARLASDTRLGQPRMLLAHLSEALRSLGVGQPVDIGVARIILPRLLKLVAYLCLEAPQFIADAVG